MVLENGLEEGRPQISPPDVALDFQPEGCRKMILVAFSASASSCRQQVGVDPQRFSIRTKSERRNHRHDLACDQFVDQFLVDPLNLAGELLVHALDDPDRHGSDRVGHHRLERVLGHTLQDEVGDARGCTDGKVERGGVGRAGPIGIADRLVPQRRQFAQLMADAVDQDDLDRQAAKNSNVDQQVAEIFIGHDLSVDGDDKNLPLKSRDVLRMPRRYGRADRGVWRAEEPAAGEGAVITMFLSPTIGRRQCTCKLQALDPVWPRRVRWYIPGGRAPGGRARATISRRVRAWSPLPSRSKLRARNASDPGGVWLRLPQLLPVVRHQRIRIRFRGRGAGGLRRRGDRADLLREQGGLKKGGAQIGRPASRGWKDGGASGSRSPADRADGSDRHPAVSDPAHPHALGASCPGRGGSPPQFQRSVR